MRRDSRLSWGVTLIFFGVLFLIKQFNILPTDFSLALYNAKNFPIYVGIIFFIFNSNRSIGLTLILIGVLLRLPDFIRFTHQWSNLIWPIFSILGGVVLVFFVKSNRK